MKVKSFPKITVSAECNQKIRNWVEIAPKEISGLGLVTEMDDGFYIDEVFLLEQECTSVETEMDDAALAALQMDLMAREGDEQDRLLFWWHSHVNMRVYWSTVDEENITKCLGDRYLVSIVYNKKGDICARIDFGNNHMTTTFDEVEVKNEPPDINIALDSVFKKTESQTIDENGQADLREFADKYLENLIEAGLAEEKPKDFDLGFMDYCQSEYDEKVTNKEPEKSITKTPSYTGNHSRNHHQHNYNTHFNGLPQTEGDFENIVSVQREMYKDFTQEGAFV